MGCEPYHYVHGREYPEPGDRRRLHRRQLGHEAVRRRRRRRSRAVYLALYQQAGSRLPRPLAGPRRDRRDRIRPRPLARPPACTPASTPSAAAPARCSSTSATARPRPGRPTASTATTTATPTPTTQPTRSPPPPTTCNALLDRAQRRHRRAPSTATTTHAPTSPTCSPAPAPTATTRDRGRAGDRRHDARPPCAPDARGDRPGRTCSAAERRSRRAPTLRCRRGRWPAGAPAQPIDARLLDNALWLLRTYRLRVTAAREAGHNTHGDGTALDLVPAEPVDQAAWDALRRRARARPRLDARLRRLRRPAGVPARARDPVRRLRGLPRPRLTAHLRARTCPAHLHISWASPCYGTSTPSPPCQWVHTFGSREPGSTR